MFGFGKTSETDRILKSRLDEIFPDMEAKQADVRKEVSDDHIKTITDQTIDEIERQLQTNIEDNSEEKIRNIFQERVNFKTILIDYLDKIYQASQVEKSKIFEKNTLEGYYLINKIQARSIYKTSLGLIVAGFFLIALGIILNFFNIASSNIGTITSISGIVVEFIAASSFYLYKEISKQTEAMVEELSYIKRINIAIELNNNSTDDKKEERISSIISSLLEKPSKKSEEK